MSRWLYLLSFAVPGLLALYGMHRYAWARLVRDLEMGRMWSRAGTTAIFALGIVVPLAFAQRRLPPGTLPGVTTLAYTWLGLLFYLVLILGLLDLGAWISKRARRTRDTSRLPRPDDRRVREDDGHGLEAERRVREGDGPANPDRRLLVKRVAAASAIASTGIIGLAGRRRAWEITTPEIAVRLPRLPPALSGFRIVQISDLHLGPILDQRFLADVVEKANAQRPDLVVITGDMVDALVPHLGRELAPLARLSARHGTAFVTGNHEYYFGPEEWTAYLRERGLRVLLNERVAIGDAGPGGASFDLAGITDLNGGRFLAEHEPDLDRALAGRDPARELVLLAHQPRQIEMARGKSVGLQLSGHTHGGQMWPFGLLVGIFQPWIAGLHRAEDGTLVYVSRGTGFWGPPMRVACPAEITTIVLTA